jgi:hypothetical protein
MSDSESFTTLRTISELISQLQEIQNRYGDLPVTFADQEDDESITIEVRQCVEWCQSGVGQKGTTKTYNVVSIGHA